METEILNLLKFLPNFEEIKHLTVDEDEADYILSLASENIKEILEANNKSFEVDLSTTEIEEVSFLVEELTFQFWEKTHTGKFCDVPLKTRKIYTLSCFYRIVYSLISSHDQQQLEDCSDYLDQGLLVGYLDDIHEKCYLFRDAIMKFLDEHIATLNIKLPYIDPIEHIEAPCDIPILECPTVEDFKVNHFIPLNPALLRGTINDWPALTKWRDMTYILKVAGNRKVPIEIGTNYTSDEWTQQFTKLRDFLKRHFAERPPDSEQLEVEYLAQHDLFDHVPVLKDDIICPKYCSLGEKSDKVDIKAWLGPKGTISPMHQDPRHNILCQVFGRKRVILASPDDTKFLYPHETEFFLNTSQINAEELDFDKFPLSKNVKFYHLTLQEGECLYMPPKWWHYIRSESKSFSVNFWFE
ncbi:bifunctional peptidase and arginyl-hydroxylase JMJD5 [Eupeodes corollae]|uniref:bifunctional peptidase and arginyl-hydroxylase JMJD5 n=1 Tax=Eupeodes corollae TaxID=290404 RepID=UPI0024920477|nr:bifunctional peptidase and arginyl-hydroxylase JMJD5 [Eupeodes corollae]